MAGDQSLERADTWRKKRRALELRLAKRSFRAISDELGVSLPTVQNWVRECTAIMLPQQELDEVRAHEADNLDQSEHRILTAMQLAAEQAAEFKEQGLPIPSLIQTISELEKRLSDVRKQRAALLGLNMPVKVNHAVTVRTSYDEEIEALVSELTGGGSLLSGPDMVEVDPE